LPQNALPKRLSIRPRLPDEHLIVVISNFREIEVLRWASDCSDF